MKPIQFYLFSICLLAFISCKKAPTFSFEKEVIGKYQIRLFHGSAVLTMDSLKKFTYKTYLGTCMGDGDGQEVQGTYKVIQDTLVLIPESIIYFSKEYGDTAYTRKDSVGYYTSDSTFIQCFYKMIPWDGDLYLLSAERISHFAKNQYQDDTSNDYERFSEFYNQNTKPNEWEGKIFCKPVNMNVGENFTLDQIPIPFRPLFHRTQNRKH